MLKQWTITFQSVQTKQVLTVTATGDSEKAAIKAFRKNWRRKWYQLLNVAEIPDMNQNLTFEQRFAAMVAKGKADFPELFIGK